VSDIENPGSSDDSDSDSESDEFPDLADMDLSGGDTEDSSDDDDGLSQPPKVSSCSCNARSDDPVLYPECKDGEKGSDQAARSSCGKEKRSKGQRASQDSRRHWQVGELKLVA
jgi:hypothetical protein